MTSRNTFSLFAAVLLVGSCPNLTACGDGPEIGKEAPPIKLAKIIQAPEGTHVNWQTLRGKVVVLEFWASSSGPCRDCIAHWNELVEKFKHQPVQFIAITDEPEKPVMAFLEQMPIQSWVGLGQSMGYAYHLQGIPTAVVVNQSGTVVAVVHPLVLQPMHLQEVLRTGKSCLPAPAQLFVGSRSWRPPREDAVVPATIIGPLDVAPRCAAVQVD